MPLASRRLERETTSTLVNQQPTPRSCVNPGRVPKEDEINQVFLLSRVMYKAILGLHFKRKEQKNQGQLAKF